MLVNEILVLDVDQRSEVDNKGGEEKQAPLGSDLDEEVADDGKDGTRDLYGNVPFGADYLSSVST